MKFDKIYILTCNRVDNQITYNQLSDNLKSKVVLVVQAWERPQYKLDCEYLVLPESIHYTDSRAVAKTRQVIYNHAKNLRYAILDDDLRFKRRNSKYWTGVSNMDTSAKICDPSEVDEMFVLFDTWLDDPNIAFCSCSQTNNPPGSTPFRDNASISSAYWIDGPKILDIVENTDFSVLSVSEDVYFILKLLNNGRQNRISTEFAVDNRSYNLLSMNSTLWDNITSDIVTQDHIFLAKEFPGIYEILYDVNSKIRSGGYRDTGKTRIHWNKAFKMWEKKQQGALNDFFS